MLKICEEIERLNHPAIIINTLTEIDTLEICARIFGDDHARRLLRDGNHPDFMELKDMKSIDSVREMLEFADVPPTFSKKLVVINTVDDLNVQSMNALLKVLEEPPPFLQFLLINRRFDRLLATIRSRCVVVYHKRDAKGEEIPGLRDLLVDDGISVVKIVGFVEMISQKKYELSRIVRQLQIFVHGLMIDKLDERLFGLMDKCCKAYKFASHPLNFKYQLVDLLLSYLQILKPPRG